MKYIHNIIDNSIKMELKLRSCHSELKNFVSNIAQAFRRRPLRYDISVDDQTEVDPREHDWLFNLNKDGI